MNETQEGGSLTAKPILSEQQIAEIGRIDAAFDAAQEAAYHDAAEHLYRAVEPDPRRLALMRLEVSLRQLEDAGADVLNGIAAIRATLAELERENARLLGQMERPR